MSATAWGAYDAIRAVARLWPRDKANRVLAPLAVEKGLLQLKAPTTQRPSVCRKNSRERLSCSVLGLLIAWHERGLGV